MGPHPRAGPARPARRTLGRGRAPRGRRVPRVLGAHATQARPRRPEARPLARPHSPRDNSRSRRARHRSRYSPPSQLLSPVLVGGPLSPSQSHSSRSSCGSTCAAGVADSYPSCAGRSPSAAVVAAITLAAGEGAAMAAALWVVLAARAVAAIPFVRTQIMRLRCVADGPVDLHSADSRRSPRSCSARSPSRSSGARPQGS